jgi:hypothetical protein
MDTLDHVAQVVPVKYQVAVIGASMVLKYCAELYSAIVNGGGLKRIASAFIYGENIPKVIAKDYKAELNTVTPPVPPTTPPPPVTWPAKTP